VSAEGLLNCRAGNKGGQRHRGEEICGKNVTGLWGASRAGRPKKKSPEWAQKGGGTHLTNEKRIWPFYQPGGKRNKPRLRWLRCNLLRGGQEP